MADVFQSRQSQARMFRIEWGRASSGVSVIARTPSAARKLVTRYQKAGYIDVTVIRRKDRRAVSIEELDAMVAAQAKASTKSSALRD